MKQKVRQDYYMILGVNRCASQEEIDDAYRKLAKEFHPDTQYEDEGVSGNFLAVQEAYEILSDPQRRKAYNSTSISFTTARNAGKRDSSLNLVPKWNKLESARKEAGILLSVIVLIVVLVVSLLVVLLIALLIEWLVVSLFFGN